MKTMIRNTLIWLYLMTSYALAIAYPQSGITHIADVSMTLWIAFISLAGFLLMVEAHRVEHGDTDTHQKAVTELTEILTILDGYSVLRKRASWAMNIALVLIITYSGSVGTAFAFLLGLLMTHLGISIARTNLATYHDRYANKTPTPAAAQ